MNPPPRPGTNMLQSKELKEYLLQKQGKGPLFAFLLTSSFVFLALLISVLKPHKLYKKYLGKIYSISITISNFPYKLHHFLLLVAGFYGSLYFFFLMQGGQFRPNKLDSYRIKMEKLDKKWVIESQLWLAFLNLVCILSVYKNIKLFNDETSLFEKIDEYDKELVKTKQKKNE